MNPELTAAFEKGVVSPRLQRFVRNVGRLHIIRPLCRVPEEEIVRISDRLELPVTSIDCRLKEKNIRTVLKPMIRELQKHNRHVRENIYRGTRNINTDYLPGPALIPSDGS